MLTLTLKNFRCYNDLTIQIPLNQTTLIKGSSGSGKSTLLKSLTWALYGQGKKKQIIPFTAAPNAKTSVSVDFNNINITRHLKPKKLILIYNQKKYQNEDAQQQINKLFGEYDIWLSTSYVAQKKDNHFLMASNANKIDMLNMIAFHEQSPTDAIDKIDKYIDKTKTIQQYKLNSYNKHLKNFNKLDTNINVLPQDELIQIQQDVQTLKNKLTTLIDIKQKYEVDKGIKNNKEQELLQYQQNYEKLLQQPIKPNANVKKLLSNDDLSMDSLNELVTQLTMINNHIKLKCELEKQLNIINYDIKKHFTLNDLQETIKNETQYEQNQFILKKYDLNYNQEDIDDYIQYCQDLLNEQQFIHCQNQFDLLLQNQSIVKQKINDIHAIIDQSLNYINHVDMSLYDATTSQQKMNELILLKGQLQQKYQQCIEAKNHISCPHCHQNVLYKNGQLVKVDHVDMNYLDVIDKQLKKNHLDIKQLQDRIDSLKLAELKTKQELDKQHNIVSQQNQLKTIQENELIKIQNDIISLQHYLNSTSANLVYNQKLTIKEQEQTKQCIQELKNIKLIEKPNMTSCEIKEYLLYQEQQFKYDEICQAIPDGYNHVMTNDIEELKDYIKQLYIYSNKKTMLQNNIDQLQNQLKQIVVLYDPNQEIEEIKTKLIYLKDVLVKNEQALILLKERNQLNEERDELLQLTQKVEDSTLLKQKAIDIECQILENVVQQINTSISEICSCLFDQDIKIELSLFKTLKVSERVKHVVNFSIFYKNGVYDNISECSGGESMLVSTAITLSLNKLYNHRLVIFDESTCYFDIDLKNKVIQTINDHLQGTCLIVQHEGISGIFDHTIDVDQLKK
jgi:DNA repair exonuclease SbcCD ATPase subunit